MPSIRKHPRRPSPRPGSWRRRFASDVAIAVASVLVLAAVAGRLFVSRPPLPAPVQAAAPAPHDDSGARAEARRRAAELERRRQEEAERLERERKDAEECARRQAEQRAEREQEEHARALRERAAGIVTCLGGEEREARVAALADARALMTGAELAGEDRERFAAEVVAAVTERRDALVAALRQHPALAAYEEVRRARQDLWKARRAAFALIDNGDVYTYAPEKDDHGAKAQPEVNRLVAAVRTLWDQRGKKTARLDPSLRPAIEEAAEAERAAIELGARGGIALGECAQMLEATAQALDVGDFCLDDAERETRAWNRRVRAFNAHPAGDMRPEELKVVELTNDYREMMGRRILEANAALGRAARAHSVVMAAKGAFSHDEDDPARRTLDQRVALEGYRGVSGENISLGPADPQDAFAAWFHSSEHHRNMLDAVYNQMGVGKVRLYWTQDFGHADPESR